MRAIKAFCIILVLFASCKDDYNRSIFEGEWYDVSPQTLLGGIRYSFNFKSRSFDIRKSTSSDVWISQCNKHFNQNDYFSGSFHFSDDSLFLKGSFVKSTYSDTSKLEQLVPDCNNTYGKEYRYVYHFKFEGDTLKLFSREGYDFGINNFVSKDTVTQIIRNKMTIFLKRE
ncbi:MAG: hypothetical protein K8I03_01495 [Ignavibacteria bacterium]|nr:hypothetical protein [Ignavibacteria bacterium]